jgi:hypothetical protein
LLPLKRIQTEKIQPLEISKGKWQAARPGKVRRVGDLGQHCLQSQAGCGIMMDKQILPLGGVCA